MAFSLSALPQGILPALHRFCYFSYSFPNSSFFWTITRERELILVLLSFSNFCLLRLRVIFCWPGLINFICCSFWFGGVITAITKHEDRLILQLSFFHRYNCAIALFVFIDYREHRAVMGLLLLLLTALSPRSCPSPMSSAFVLIAALLLMDLDVSNWGHFSPQMNLSSGESLCILHGSPESMRSED